MCARVRRCSVVAPPTTPGDVALSCDGSRQTRIYALALQSALGQSSATAQHGTELCAVRGALLERIALAGVAGEAGGAQEFIASLALAPEAIEQVAAYARQ